MTGQPKSANDLASLVRRVIAPLRIVTNLNEVLAEMLEINADEIEALIADPRSVRLDVLFRLTDAAKDIGEELRDKPWTGDKRWTDEAFWTARQQLDDRLLIMLGGSPTAAAAPERPLEPPMTDEEIRAVSLEVAATLRLREANDRRELKRQATAAGRSPREYKRELAETGVRLTLASIDTPQEIRLREKWETDDEGHKRLVRPRDLEATKQRDWLLLRAKDETIAALRGEDARGWSTGDGKTARQGVRKKGAAKRATKRAAKPDATSPEPAWREHYRREIAKRASSSGDAATAPAMATSERPRVPLVVSFDEEDHAEALEDARDEVSPPEAPWEKGAPDGPLTVVTGDEEHPDLVAGVRPLAVKFDASPEQLEALRRLPSTVLELVQHATPEQQQVLTARAQCQSWAEADRLLGKTSGYSRDVARRIHQWLLREWGDPDPETDP